MFAATPPPVVDGGVTDLWYAAAAVITATTALVTALGMILRAWLRHPLDEINRAVNHQGPDEPRLIDRVRQQGLALDDIGVAMSSHSERTEDIAAIARDASATSQRSLKVVEEVREQLVTHLAFHETQHEADKLGREGELERRKKSGD